MLHDVRNLLRRHHPIRIAVQDVHLVSDPLLHGLDLQLKPIEHGSQLGLHPLDALVDGRLECAEQEWAGIPLVRYFNNVSHPAAWLSVSANGRSFLPR